MEVIDLLAYGHKSDTLQLLNIFHYHFADTITAAGIS